MLRQGDSDPWFSGGFPYRIYSIIILVLKTPIAEETVGGRGTVIWDWRGVWQREPCGPSASSCQLPRDSPLKKIRAGHGRGLVLIESEKFQSLCVI